MTSSSPRVHAFSCIDFVNENVSASGFFLEGLRWPRRRKKCYFLMAVESSLGACVTLYVCFYLLSTHLKGLVCVVLVGVF